jgi:hypothetical protein
LTNDGGYSIGRRRGDQAKASAATSHNFEFESKVIDPSDVQYEKHDLQNTSTDAGMWIVVKRLLVNADSSIRCNLEFDSNVTDVSDSQLEKQSLHSTSTDAGT